MSISDNDSDIRVDLPEIRFVRRSRSGRQWNETAGVFATDTPAARTPDRSTSRPQPVRVVNRPARFPTMSVWPFELRADMVAAALDFRTTRELCKAIAAGDAPQPTGIRGQGERREPVWSMETIRAFADRRSAAPAPPCSGQRGAV